jgi:hypothetical protein
MVTVGITWAGGKDMRDAQRRTRDREKALNEGMVRILEISVAEGALYTQDILEAAVTKTGLRREREEGGFPGRHDTGNMVGSIGVDDRSTVPTRGPKVMMSWGWFARYFKQYFRDQDLGEGAIPAARALPQAFFRAQARFENRVRRFLAHGTVD